MSQIKVIRAEAEREIVAYLRTESGGVYVPKEKSLGGGYWSPKGVFTAMSYNPEIFKNLSGYEPLYKGDKLEITL